MNNKTYLKQDKQELLIKITALIDSIPVPPPGREMALVKTNIEQARLWLKESIEKET